MSEISFSVVIPLYNKEKSIANTIKSVLNQTYRNFELIIVNDGSTDSSLNVVQSINDDRIKIIDKENGGVSSTRNHGIKEAKYDWIAFLDGDDEWLPNFLSEMNLLITRYPDCNIFAANYYISSGRAKFTASENSDVVPIFDNYFELAMHLPIITSSSVVIRKGSFDEVSGFNTKYTHGEDLDLWARLYKKYKQIILSRKELVIYNHSAENRASNVIPKAKKHFAYYIDLTQADSKAEREYYLHQIASLAWMYMKYPGFKELYYVFHKYRHVAILIVFRIAKNLYDSKKNSKKKTALF